MAKGYQIVTRGELSMAAIQWKTGKKGGKFEQISRFQTLMTYSTHTLSVIQKRDMVKQRLKSTDCQASFSTSSTCSTVKLS